MDKKKPSNVIHLSSYRTTKNTAVKYEEINRNEPVKENFHLSSASLERIEKIKTILAFWITFNLVFLSATLFIVPTFFLLNLLFMAILNGLFYYIPLFKDSGIMHITIKTFKPKSFILYNRPFQADNENYRNTILFHRFVPSIYNSINRQDLVCSRKVYDKTITNNLYRCKRNVFGVVVSVKEVQ